MADPLKTFENEALKLPQKDRAELARVLLLSLDSEDDDIEEVWAAEAERRYEELKSGAVEAVPSEVVFADARALLE